MKSIPVLVLNSLLVTSPLIIVRSALAETYSYDAQGRIASVKTDSGVITYYCYDAAGNRTYVGPTPC